MTWNSQIVPPEEAGDALDSVLALIEPSSLRIDVFAEQDDEDGTALIMLVYRTEPGTNTSWEAQVTDPENAASALASASGTVDATSLQMRIFGVRDGRKIRPRLLLLYTYS